MALAVDSNMNNLISRRELIKAGLVGGAGTLLLGRLGLRQVLAGETESQFCVTLCNHWSYIGIGWQLGIESDVLSVTDAMETADREPHVKTCINLDARAIEFMAAKFPEVAQRLKRYLAEGKVELIGGTYGQPMGTTVSGESNIRQLVIGRQTILAALGYEMVTFLEEEEFSHPQVPQIALGAGYRYSSLAQLDTWGRAGIPVVEFNAIRWQGIDGSSIPCVPKNSLFQAPLEVKKLVESAAFKKLRALGKPLLFAWEEFGWEDPEHPAYLHASDRYKALADQYPVEFVTLREYLDKYGAEPKETVLLPMDAWTKSLTWGLGGDQVRIMARKVEGLLLAAELFDAVATGLGAPTQYEFLYGAWRDLLASQSHDVGLCEYSRWQGDRMAPLDRIEDFHNLTWGNIGFEHLDKAQERGQNALDGALGNLVARIDSKTSQQGGLAVIVFNPHAWDRTDLVFTGRVYPLPEKTQSLVVKDGQGRQLPTQLLKSEKDDQGNLVVAELAFPVSQAPSAGYDTYFLESAPAAARPGAAGLETDETKLILENAHLRVVLDPLSGAVASLVHEPSGRETLRAERGAFPRFTGRPNPNLSLHPNPPPLFDSAGLKAELDWVAKGPLLATVRARHHWKYLTFETRVTLAADRPYVEVISRVLAMVPPHSDASPPDIKEGYWLSFAPAFNVSSVLRDYPLAIEPTKHKAFHALTFVDLLGDDLGLLVLHPGTQWFSRDDNGVVSNLVMREWESHFTREYGWPIYAEYRHALMPHGLNFTNAERLRAATAFVEPLLCRVGRPHAGDQPSSKSFVRLAPESIMLSCLRTEGVPKNGAVFECRVIETQGETADGRLALGFPTANVLETDLLGRTLGEVKRDASQLALPMPPWKIRTLRLR
jgi:hypothetical protein